MTTNAMYHAEYYDASAAEESDPDPVFVTEADNTDDIFVAIANHVGVPIVGTYLDTEDSYDRYGINEESDPTNNIGVVLIGTV